MRFEWLTPLLRLHWWVTLPLLCLFGLSQAESGTEEEAGLDFYERRIRPVLVKHCYECHSADAKNIQAGLRLDTAGAMRSGGDSGPVINPGRPEQSLLVDAVSYSGEISDMPPSGKLPERQIKDLRKWIAMGAPLPDDDSSNAPQPKKSVSIEHGRTFWSFQPLKFQKLPNVDMRDWPKRPLDQFVLRKLEDHGFHPAPATDRRTYIRRVSFDLTGLPPTLEQIARFVSDKSKDAFEQLLDRLLASPHYGERWSRHWLDIARYAEDNPTSEDTCRPPLYPWPYRDWVIRSLNDDTGYDEFVRRQLAADLMSELGPEQIAATGFLGVSPVYHKEPRLSAPVISIIAADEWDERLDTVTRGLLGLTVACARCHDHKFDPIRMEDYYALAGVMASTQLVEWPLVETSHAEATALTQTRQAIVDYEQRVNYAEQMQTAAKIEQRPGKIYEMLIRRHQETLETLKQRELFTGPIANAVRDAGVWVDGRDPDWTVMEYRAGEPRDLPIFIRGNPNNHGKVVRRRFIEVLSNGPPRPFHIGSGRLELADAMFTDAQALAARVIVNRVWGWHCGQPLVRTPSNFGAQGDRPSHPRLLDDLARRFVAHNWSLKWLHREIMLSATYRQASQGYDETKGHTADPSNRLLWKMNRLRLEPEIWRDAVLAVCGRLDTTMFGKSENLDEYENRRRTIYGKVSRQTNSSVLQLFDFPDGKRHADRRVLTTTPLQQLYFLNSPFLLQHSALMSEKDGKFRSSSVQRLFQTILLRRPDGDELKNAEKLLTSASSRQTGLHLLAHSLLASNEFLFVD
ncbi:MAG: PSD1 and planctomycete cytochrome C domain-containing protein [Fuerstiella sp.]|nr:PSD1 and planctomycete cytochrome C domain-containing protein [Fuerstiella sp.]